MIRHENAQRFKQIMGCEERFKKHIFLGQNFSNQYSNEMPGTVEAGYCEKHPEICRNGGTCRDLAAGFYECDCIYCWEGPYCTESTGACL